MGLAEISNPGEQWRPIRGYDLYLISNQGRVLRTSARRTGANAEKGALITLTRRKTDGIVVKLSDRVTKRRATVDVHRLVAEAFLQDTKPEIDEATAQLRVEHINGRKDDNRAENLRWKIVRVRPPKPPRDPNLRVIRIDHLGNDLALRERLDPGLLGCSGEDVRAIRRCAAKGLTLAQIAEQFNTSEAVIDLIVNLPERGKWRVE